MFVRRTLVVALLALAATAQPVTSHPRLWISAGVLVFSAGPYMHGDVNADESIDGADVVYLANYLFAGGPTSVGSGDVNADSSVGSADLFYLINYRYADGAAPLLKVERAGLPNSPLAPARRHSNDHAA